MKPREHNANVSRDILKEIEDVNRFLEGRSMEEFLSSILLQKATVMSLLNIGELTKSFTDALVDAMPWMPWHDIRSARNIAAHKYYALDMDDVWETYRADLPQMQTQMQLIITRLESGWDPAKEAFGTK